MLELHFLFLMASIQSFSQGRNKVEALQPWAWTHTKTPASVSQGTPGDITSWVLWPVRRSHFWGVTSYEANDSFECHRL